MRISITSGSWPPDKIPENQKNRQKSVSSSFASTAQASVKQSAAEPKFSSEFYMSRFFKKHTGMSPSKHQDKFRR